MNIILFNKNLRISDNPALFHALENGGEILAIFILDEKNKRALGGASKVFLHHNLQDLEKNLANKFNLKLHFSSGDSLKILEEIFQQQDCQNLYFNQEIEPDAAILEENINKLATKFKVNLKRYKSYLLFDPKDIKNGSGEYFKVFTPFSKKCLSKIDLIAKPLKNSKNKAQNANFSALKLDDLKLLPSRSWGEEISKNWQISEIKAQENLQEFLQKKIFAYDENRNLPNIDGTSQIAPFLHFGTLSIREVFWQIWKIYLEKIAQNSGSEDKGVKQFLNEIFWREFSHHLLYHFKKLPSKNFKALFDKFPWQENAQLLEKWQKGETGYPIVDAGMKELYATGFMHNRVRMIVASFLIKDLLIDWREGEKWFWDCLFDANLASNVANWQWVAGSGADAAPYFRIFNPVLQGEKFDKNGEYVRKWLPVLQKLPNKFIHKPWEADDNILKSCLVDLGKNYPNRVVDHKKARDTALMLYKSLG